MRVEPYVFPVFFGPEPRPCCRRQPTGSGRGRQLPSGCRTKNLFALMSNTASPGTGAVAVNAGVKSTHSHGRRGRFPSECARIRLWLRVLNAPIGDRIPDGNDIKSVVDRADEEGASVAGRLHVGSNKEAVGCTSVNRPATS